MKKQPINASGIKWGGVMGEMTKAFGGHHESAVAFHNKAVMPIAKQQGDRFPAAAVERLRICLFQVFDADGGAPLEDKFSTRRRAALNDKVYEFACRPGEQAAVTQVLDQFAEQYADFNRDSVAVAEPSEKTGEVIPEGVFERRIKQMVREFLNHGNPQHMKLHVRKGDFKRNMEDGTPFPEYIARQVATSLSKRQLGKLKKVPTVDQEKCIRVKLFNQKEKPGDCHPRDFFIKIPLCDGVLMTNELTTEWGYDRNKQAAA